MNHETNLAAAPDIVITVCGRRNLLNLPGHGITYTHWGVDDPAKSTGTREEIDAVFMHAYRSLRTGLEAFLALPLNNLRQNTSALKAALHNIESLNINHPHAN